MMIIDNFVTCIDGFRRVSPFSRSEGITFVSFVCPVVFSEMSTTYLC